MTPSVRAAAEASSSCRCGAELLRLEVLLEQESMAMDDFLKITVHAINFWPKLKACQSCLLVRLDKLLAVFDKLVGMLEEKSGTSQRPVPTLNDAPGGSATTTHSTTTTLQRCDTSKDSANSVPKLPGQQVPPMFFGDLRLDHKQSLCLLHILEHDVLKQLALTLYEIRQIETCVDARLEGFVDNVLCKVLHLMERAAQHK